MAYSIMLDAGHGGTKDPGAVYKGRQEKDDNLRLVLAIGGQRTSMKRHTKKQ